MYTKIQQLKEKGFKTNAVANQLNIHRETVKRYWNMTVDEFENFSYSLCKTSLLSSYESVILSWLTQFPTMSAAQVCDWLKEHYKEYFAERTVSRYVKNLRNEYNILKTVLPRDFEAVEDLPLGKQLQVDFGEEWMKSIDGSKVKVRFVAFVLANSRYKYTQFQNRAFTTVDLVNACNNCFKFFGGVPLELVFDQDSIVSVSENYGDVIHTYEFEKLRQQLGFSVYLCRAADPQTKGKVENCVKFIKYNFLHNRLYVNDEILNACALEWLDRTGNGKVHSTTKKIPKEAFEIEREYLKPLLEIPVYACSQIYRTVRKDNTILYDSNRYSVPVGTYNRQKEVEIKPIDGTLIINTTFGDYICDHPISSARGALIKNTSHSRDTSNPIDKLQSEIDEALSFKATEFLQIIRTEKVRYSRDQFKLLQSLCDKYGATATLLAIEFCMSSKLYSVTFAKEYLEHLNKPKQEFKKLPIPVSNNKYHISTEKRSVDVYAKAGGV